jgi:hypothetical protein
VTVAECGRIFRVVNGAAGDGFGAEGGAAASIVDFRAADSRVYWLWGSSMFENVTNTVLYTKFERTRALERREPR